MWRPWMMIATSCGGHAGLSSEGGWQMGSGIIRYMSSLPTLSSQTIYKKLEEEQISIHQMY